MTKFVQVSVTANTLAKLKTLFGPPPVLGSEDPKAYDGIMAQILEAIKPRDFIEEMFVKNMTDALWEMKRCLRHKDLVLERQYREQHERDEEPEDAGEGEQVDEPTSDAEPADRQAEEGEQGDEPTSDAEPADRQAEDGEQGDEPTSAEPADRQAEDGEQVDQGEEVKEPGAPTTQFERMVELEDVLDTIHPVCHAIIDGPVDELEYAAALESNINYYERLDRLYGVAVGRLEDVLKQFDLYRQGLGSHLRRVADAIIEGEFSETTQEPASIPGPDTGGQ